MVSITDGFTYIAFLVLLAGLILFIEQHTHGKVFSLVPSLVWVYVLNMIFGTLGMYDGRACGLASDALKDNLLYAMIFVLALHCDLHKLVKVSGRLLAVYVSCTGTLASGFLCFYPLMRKGLGSDTWGAVAALFASWTGGNTNLASMQAALPIEPGAYSCAVALDTVCYSLWMAVVFFATRFSKTWNAITKADTSVMDSAAMEVEEKPTKQAIPVAGDWLFLLGLSLGVSVLSQKLGGLFPFGKGVGATLVATVSGLLCAMTRLGRLPAIDELGTVYLYLIVSLVASEARLGDLLSAPLWIVFGVSVLSFHALCMALLSKWFHWDLGIVATASMANIGGPASASLVASAYDPHYAAVAVLMGILGSALGNFLGLAMGAVLRLMT